MARDEEIAALARDRVRLRRLWEVCQTPDFRKTTLDEHARMVRAVFLHLTSNSARLPDDWIAEQHRALDNLHGEIDVLAQRLANIRTLAYAANRPDWLRDPAHWQARTRELEDRLSDTLHERLMQRFIDRRTSALLRGLNLRDDVLAGVGHDGTVTVEGHEVGRLIGVRFEPVKGATALEDRALRTAAARAVGPLLAKRLGELAAAADDAFTLDEDGTVRWAGEAAGRLAGGGPFAPRVALFGELGPAHTHLAAARERAQRRLEAFVAGRSAAVLAPLKALADAVASGGLRGLARGVAYRMLEAGGVLDRAEVAREVAALSLAERRTLKALRVRFGAFSLFIPALLSPQARAQHAPFARRLAPDWRPPVDAISSAPAPAPPPAALAAYGLRTVAGLCVPVEALERLDGELRRLAPERGASRLPADAAAALGWSAQQTAEILRGLGYAPAARPDADGSSLWRRRRAAPAPAPDATPAPRTGSPFAALADLRLAPEPAPRTVKAPTPLATPAPAAARRPRRRRTRPKAPAAS